jgi:hypothetical protein
VNPNNEMPSIEYQLGETTQYFYDSKIANRAPFMLRVLILCWLILVFASLILIRRPLSKSTIDAK